MVLSEDVYTFGGQLHAVETLNSSAATCMSHQTGGTAVARPNWSFLHEVGCGLCQSTVWAGLLDSYPGAALADIVEGANVVASVKGQQPQLQDTFLLACNHLNLHFPQLVQDGLGPAEHLVVAQNVVHQYL